MIGRIEAALLAGLALGLAPSAGAATPETLEGYAEWYLDGCLVVDGQRVCPASGLDFHGEGVARTFATVPLGYEVKVKQGTRLEDGTVLAQRVEARPNDQAMFEAEVRAATDQMEARIRRDGELSEGEGLRARRVGKLLETGPRVERVRRIVDNLVPPYLPPEDVRVYVIENDEWNAFAMGNYSIYVFSGLLDDMNDDEVAIVLGHEIAHATHEHSRKQFKKQMWIQLAALGLGLVNEQVKDENANAIIELVGQFGSLAWQNGYGRSHEDQADRVGLRYAYEAGFDIDQGPELWRRFAQKYGQEDAVHNFFFSDHSLATKRAAHLEREIALNYPNGPKRAAGSAPQSTPPRRAAVKAKTSPPPPARGPREVTPGMTTDEVLALLGQPSDQITFGRKARWVYQDRTVVFEGGRVTTVRF